MFECGRDHEQRRNILRTDLRREFHGAAAERLPLNAQWGETFFFYIVYFCTKAAECVDEQGDGTLFHARTSGEHARLSGASGEVSGEKAHGGAGCPDVDGESGGVICVGGRFCTVFLHELLFTLGRLSVILLLISFSRGSQRGQQSARVVAVGEVVNRSVRSGQRTENQCARRDAFARRKRDVCAQRGGKLNQHRLVCRQNSRKRSFNALEKYFNTAREDTKRWSEESTCGS